MKKKVISTYVLTFCLGIVSATAAVTPPQQTKVVAPQTSTADDPKWYIMMSSHLSDSDRQNRFLKWDGTNAVTEKFASGMSENDITDNFRWRLDDAGDGYIVFVNAASGLQITVPNTADATNNTSLTMTETGSKWAMKPSKETGQNDCADKQYCFNYVDYGSAAYLNAMPGANIPSYGITIYEAGVHQASGWFFYEAPQPEEGGEISTAIRETATTSFYYNAASQAIVCGQPAHIVIYDITGKIRLDSQAADQLSVASLPAGIYIANINGKPLKFTK